MQRVKLIDDISTLTNVVVVDPANMRTSVRLMGARDLRPL